MYFPKPAINENDLAIIERGDTAEHSIEAGQYVSWKGKLGKANSAILQGATLDDSLFEYETDGVINSLANNILEDRSDRINVYGSRLNLTTKIYWKLKNGMVFICLMGTVATSMATDTVSLCTVSGTNPKCVGTYDAAQYHLGAAMMYLLNGQWWIDRQSGHALSNGEPITVVLWGYEAP